MPDTQYILLNVKIPHRLLTVLGTSGQATRAGWFFVPDRVTGKNLVSKPFTCTGNRARGVDAKGEPIPDPDKEPKVDGSMIDMPVMGATNWQPPSYSRQSELFRILTTSGKLLFTGDLGEPGGFHLATRKLLWHQQLTQAVSNGPSGYMPDGKQFTLAGKK